LSDDFETPGDIQLRRLRRRVASSPTTNVDHPPSPTPLTNARELNAFDILNRNARLQAKGLKQGAKLVESEYVEAEAQESDDDELYGFGNFVKKGDDGEGEEDGEDLDKNLDGLVDDTVMDGDVLAEDKVMEKVMSVNFLM
jgi:mediator of replication checkpoint protein 1